MQLKGRPTSFWHNGARVRGLCNLKGQYLVNTHQPESATECLIDSVSSPAGKFARALIS